MKKLLALIVIIFIFIVYADKSSASQTWQPKAGENWIGINKEQLRLTLYNGPDPVKAWQISIGKGKGTEKKSRFDLITPSGTFTIYRVV